MHLDLTTLLVISLSISRYIVADVVEISIELAGDASWTPNTVHFTLWFEFIMYQFSWNPDDNGDIYTTTTPTILGTSHCPKSNPIPEPQIMIENDDTDGVIINKIRFETTSGEWYGIEGRCADDALLSIQSWLNDKDYRDYMINHDGCKSGKTNIYFCIDNQDTDCGPYKQMFYFDTSRSNQYIMNALWSDATDVFPRVLTCDPTQKPTKSPTQKPNVRPTKKPSPFPTDKPSSYPTEKPTAFSTQKLTAFPTQKPIHTAFPTKKPTVFPTQKPTAFPTQKPSMFPTQKPSAFPTGCPTEPPSIHPTTQTPTQLPYARLQGLTIIAPFDVATTTTMRVDVENSDAYVPLDRDNDTQAAKLWSVENLILIGSSMIVTMSCISVCVCGVFWYMRRRKGKEKTSPKDGVEHIVHNTKNTQVVHGRGRPATKMANMMNVYMKYHGNVKADPQNDAILRNTMQQNVVPLETAVERRGSGSDVRYDEYDEYDEKMSELDNHQETGGRIDNDNESVGDDDLIMSGITVR